MKRSTRCCSMSSSKSTAQCKEQQKEIDALKSGTERAKEAQIQKVSAQIEASKPAPQVVNNP